MNIVTDKTANVKIRVLDVMVSALTRSRILRTVVDAESRVLKAASATTEAAWWTVKRGKSAAKWIQTLAGVTAAAQGRSVACTAIQSVASPAFPNLTTPVMEQARSAMQLRVTATDSYCGVAGEPVSTRSLAGMNTWVICP